MQEKLNKNQLKTRMDICLLTIGFFSAITLVSSLMVYLTI